MGGDTNLVGVYDGRAGKGGLPVAQEVHGRWKEFKDIRGWLGIHSLNNGHVFAHWIGHVRVMIFRLVPMVHGWITC